MRVRWSLVLLVASAVAVTVFCGYLLATWPPGPRPDARAVRGEGRSVLPGAPLGARPSARPARTPAPTTSPASPTASLVAREEPLLGVLGDSFSAASRVSKGAEWPRLVGDTLGWRVVVEAGDGSGYVPAGRGRPFVQDVPALVRESPDVVVVAGGFHGMRVYPAARVSRAADRLVAELERRLPRARIVVVSPFSRGHPGPLTRQVSGGLRRVAQRHGVGYVDATGWLAGGRNLIAADRIHPTDRGQQRLSGRMAKALKRLGVTTPNASSGG